MKPFRKNLAIAIDGGGIRGAVVTRALSILEANLGRPLHQVARLFAGTSTGSIISASLAAGFTAERVDQLYLGLGAGVFRPGLRKRLFPLTKHRYSSKPLRRALESQLGGMQMKDLWKDMALRDVVITTFDITTNKTCFIKPWKLQYQDWTIVKAVMASSAVPTYFQAVDGRFIDGGVGSYSNPCYIAAYELKYCLGWKPEETTLLSLGTGRRMHSLKPGDSREFQAWNWITPVVDAFVNSASEQQVRLVDTFFKDLDFRRFQVDITEEIGMDNPRALPRLSEYGEIMGQMIVNDHTDDAVFIRPSHPQPH